MGRRAGAGVGAVAAVWMVGALAFGVWALAFLRLAPVSARGVHTASIEAFGAGVPVTQGFTTASRGLRAVRVRVTSSAPADLRLEYRISTAIRENSVERYRASRRIANLSGARWIRLEFLPIDLAAGEHLEVELRVLGVTARAGGEAPAVALVAMRDVPPPGSYLRVDGRERWGALLFDAEAIGDTVFGRFRMNARDRLPAWLRSTPAIVSVLAAYAVLLAGGIGALAGPRRPAGQAGPVGETPSSPPRDPRRLAFGWAVTVGLGAALAAVVWIVRTEHGGIDLIEELHAAELQSDWKFHEGFELRDVEIGTRTLRAITALPSSRIVWRLTPSPGAQLETAVAVMPVAWPLGGDGAYFRILAEQEGRSTELLARQVDPRHAPDDQRWIPIEIDLSPFAGRPIDLVFVTEASPPGGPSDPSYDFALWGRPRIVTTAW